MKTSSALLLLLASLASFGNTRAEPLGPGAHWTFEDTDTHIAWKAPQGVPSTSSPLIVEGSMLMAGDNGGMGSRLDASTGGETRKERLGLAALPARTAPAAVTPVLQEPLLLAHYMPWYATRELNDYAALHRNTQRFIPWLKRAGLRFAICYEDQALKQLHPGDDLKQGTLDLQWAEKHCKGFDHGQMAEPAFPLLLQFVRQHSITPAP